jgi:hypothetical protein
MRSTKEATFSIASSKDLLANSHVDGVVGYWCGATAFGELLGKRKNAAKGDANGGRMATMRTRFMNPARYNYAGG